MGLLHALKLLIEALKPLVRALRPLAILLPPIDRSRKVQLVAGLTGTALWFVYAGSLALETTPTVTMARIPIYLAVYVCGLVAMGAELRISKGVLKRTWAAAIIAMIIAIVGTAYYEIVIRPLPVRPYPAASDLGRFMIDGLIYYGIVAQLRVRMKTWHPSIWLDGTIVAATVIGVGLQFWLTPMQAVNAGNMAATVVSFFYILGDLSLLAAILGGYAMLGWVIDRQWFAFSMAILVLTIGDGVLFTQQALNAHSSHRILVDLGMMGATNALTWSVVLPESSRRSNRQRETTGYGVIIAPGLATIVSLVLTTPLGSWDPSPLTQLASALALLGVIARSLLTYREMHSLAEARLEVRTDQLTGLLNRRGFTEEVTRMLAITNDDGSSAIGRLLLIDIRKFKEINDSLGHQSGDTLLASFAARMQELAPEGYLVGRLGGNEFAVFKCGSIDVDFCADQIHALSDVPFEIDGISLHLSIGASVSVSPDHGKDFASLIRAADIAMTHSKCSHDLVTFTEDMAAGFEQSRVIATSELRRALDHDEIAVHYQPKVRLTDEYAYGVEALVRWQHPTDGMIFPDQFLPLVEQAGLMPRLTDVVMVKAIHDVSSWHRNGLPLSLAVNLPAAAILDVSLPDRVHRLLVEAGLPSSALTVEITEQTLLGDRTRCREVLAALRRQGISVSIDDYGTGYSSLAYLRELPVDELKLDKSFVFPMSSDPRAAAIVRSTIDLAHSLGLAIVAEGVEDDETARQLAAYDCDTAQGYFFSRPVSATALQDWFLARLTPALPAQRV